MFAVPTEPGRNDPPSIANLQSTFPQLGQKQPSENVSLPVNFGQACGELFLAFVVWLVRILRVKKHVDQALCAERARSSLRKWRRRRRQVEMLPKFIGDTSNPFCIRVV